MSASVAERSIEIDGMKVFVRERPGSGIPTIFVHGNPTSSADWIPFLERLDGAAIAPDLPGFGRSARPDASRFDHSLDSYASFFAGFLDEVAAERYRLVVHDWGALALVAAQRAPERVERLVVINAVPFNADYRWHWVARAWRRRGIGEAFNALNSRFATAQLLRLARPGRRPMPRAFVDGLWSRLDAGTRRAILALYRSADPAVLAAAGAGLGALDCPALVVWGVDDPYIGVDQGRWYAEVLPGAELLELDRAGHWPWIDRPELVERVASFLSREA